MKQLLTLLLASLLVVGLTPTVKAQEEDRVCVLQKDEKGNALNEEEYLSCLEGTGQTVEPLENKWPGSGN